MVCNLCRQAATLSQLLRSLYIRDTNCTEILLRSFFNRGGWIVPQTALRLALVDADEPCVRELRRRTCQEIVQVDSAAPNEEWLARCDAVVIWNSSASGDLINRCVNAQKPALIVPGVTLTADQLQKCAGLAAANGTCFRIGNPLLHLPSRQLILDQLDTGKLGEAGLVRVHHWTHGAEEQLAAGLPRLASNEIHLVIRCFRQAPQRVFAMCQPDDRGWLIHLGFPSGGMALLDFSSGCPSGDTYTSFSLIASRGAAYADDHQNMQLLYRGGRPQGLLSRETASPDALMVCAFIEGLQQNNRRASVDFAQHAAQDIALWAKTQLTLAAVQESLRTRQVCTLQKNCRNES